MGETSLDRYASFGFRNTWLESFVNHYGDIDFWVSEADGLAPNKRQESCHQFLTDAGIVTGKWSKKTNKETGVMEIDYTPIKNTAFGNKVCELGAENSAVWAVILINLLSDTNNPTFRWFYRNCEMYMTYEPAVLMEMLQSEFMNDAKGHGKKNVIDSLKIIFSKTPLGSQRIAVNIDYTEGNRGDITLNSITRQPWFSPVPEVILYSLYKFAEACGGYYQFSLAYLMDESIEREGVSPTTIFGLDRETMIQMLNGLSINYHDYITATFSLDLETITLNKDIKAEDILQLIG